MGTIGENLGSLTVEALAQYVSIWVDNLWILHTNSFFISIFRWVGWMIAKSLTWLATACAKIYDLAFNFVDFTSFPAVQDFVDSWQPVVAAVLVLSLFVIGLLLIVGHERKPKIVVNLCLAVLVISSSTYLLQLMNNALLAGKEAIVGSNAANPVYDTIATNIYDLIYMDEQVGLANFTGDRSEYPSYETITQTELDAIDINEVINYKTNQMTTEDAKVILRYKPVYLHGKGYILQEVYNGFGWNSVDDDDWFNGFYYRYTVDWWPLYLALGSLCIVYLLMGYKVFRLLFEVGIFQVVALVTSANLSSSQKALKVLDAIKNSYIVLLSTCVLLKFYSLAVQFISQSTITNNSFIKGIFLIFLALAVIDGPNLIQQLFGIDVGLSSSMGHLFAVTHMAGNAGRMAGGAAKGTADGIRRIVKAIQGSSRNHGDKSRKSEKEAVRLMDQSAGGRNGQDALWNPSSSETQATPDGNGSSRKGRAADGRGRGEEQERSEAGSVKRTGDEPKKEGDIPGEVGFGTPAEQGTEAGRLDCAEDPAHVAGQGLAEEGVSGREKSPLEGMDAYGRAFPSESTFWQKEPEIIDRKVSTPDKKPTVFAGEIFRGPGKRSFPEGTRNRGEMADDFSEDQKKSLDPGITGSSWAVDEYQREQRSKK